MNHISSSDNLSRSQRLAEQALSTLQRFLHVKAVSGGVPLVAAAAALICANFAHDYHALWDLPLTLGFGPYVFSKSVHFWVNDALMTYFSLSWAWLFSAFVGVPPTPIINNAKRDSENAFQGAAFLIRVVCR